MSETVAEIVDNYLRDNCYDGLYSESFECACFRCDLFPCDGNGCESCLPGYRVIVPENIDSEFKEYICSEKDAKPWERE